MATNFFTSLGSQVTFRSSLTGLLPRNTANWSTAFRNEGKLLRPRLLHVKNRHRPLSQLPSQRNTKMTLLAAGGIFSVGLGLSAAFRLPVYCDAPETVPAPVTSEQLRKSDPSSPPPQSSVSLYELGFGTVTGICAGIFVKKGAKAVAWAFGGIFMLLQFLGSSSVVRVNWQAIGSKFENLFYTRDAAGASRPPTVVSLWNWLINFLTADFPPRASFIAGFTLGLRIG